ncbi:hypothetical protein AAVH_12966 [Aphelenchoides avenae]|nr:hypothetical protein AAVH_12966 [Aphelenchus avenae]
MDRGNFCVTDDAVVEFCMREDDEVAQEGNDPLVYPDFRNGSFTKGLFKRVVQVIVSWHVYPGHVSLGPVTKNCFTTLLTKFERRGKLRIDAHSAAPNFRVPWRVENEDIRDFAAHLSYVRDRGTSGEMRVYDFPGEQREAVAAVHLQMVLYPHNMLKVIRARRPQHIFL